MCKTCSNCKFCADINSPNWKECLCTKKDLIVLSTDAACEDDFQEPVYDDTFEEIKIPDDLDEFLNIYPIKEDEDLKYFL